MTKVLPWDDQRRLNAYLVSIVHKNQRKLLTILDIERRHGVVPTKDSVAEVLEVTHSRVGVTALEDVAVGVSLNAATKLSIGGELVGRRSNAGILDWTTSTLTQQLNIVVRSCILF